MGLVRFLQEPAMCELRVRFDKVGGSLYHVCRYASVLAAVHNVFSRHYLARSRAKIYYVGYTLPS